MKTINIRVSDKAAKKFLSMNEEEKNRLSQLFNEMVEDKRTLLQVMDDMSEYAKKQGLTPEILDELLNDNSE
jgi:predicted CopG family antitoxin